MIIDFKEIPQANKGGGQQDTFEQFTREFLEAIGYKILRGPDRGADGKRDLIVSETMRRVKGEQITKWLVSCKHHAHGGNSVIDTDEEDVADRVLRHDCNGFMGIYSTIPSSSLTNKLEGLKDRQSIDYIIFDVKEVEKELLKSKDKYRILKSYFPKSYEKYLEQEARDVNNRSKEKSKIVSLLTEDDILRISKTAIIILEIEKLKFEFNEDSEWDAREKTIKKLFTFSDHSNPAIAIAVIEFLSHAASITRAGMPAKIAYSISSLVDTYYYYSSYSFQDPDLLSIGKLSVDIGFHLAYDAFIHLENFRIAESGLSILKSVYIQSKRSNIKELSDYVLEIYADLELTLRRPERIDLGNALELVKIYKDDLKNDWLRDPDLPNHLFDLIMDDSQK